MSRTLLSQSFVDQATCPADKAKHDYFDTQLTGLLLKVASSNKRTYYLRYRDSHGKPKERKLFDADVVSLSDARTKAKRLLSKIALGQDPFAVQAAKREVPTLADFFHDSYLPYLKTSKKSWKVDEERFRLRILPYIGKLYLDEIDPQCVIYLVNQNTEGFKPATTNRMTNVLSSMFTCALCWSVPGVTSNPVAFIKKLKENNQRDRYVTSPELQSLLAAAERSNSKMLPYIVKMLVYTGARKNEVLNARWDHIDWANCQWKIAENKSGKARYVPLSGPVIDLLKQMYPESNSAYIFANPETLKPYNDIFYPWDTARKLAGIPDVRIHDLRHTAASYMVNIGITIYEVAEMLGHSNVRTTQRYAHLSQERQLKSSNQLADYINQSTSLIEASAT